MHQVQGVVGGCWEVKLTKNKRKMFVCTCLEGGVEVEKAIYREEGGVRIRVDMSTNVERERERKVERKKVLCRIRKTMVKAR